MSANRPTPSKLSSKYKKLVREARKAESPRSSIKSKDEDIIEISSEEEPEVDNIEISRASSWTSITRRQPRRDSTILAGNITVPVDTESEDDEPILTKPNSYSNYRTGQGQQRYPFTRPVPPGAPGTGKRTAKGSAGKSKGRGRGAPAKTMTNLAEITEDEDEIVDTLEKDELITEDETDFYSCEDNNSLKEDDEVNSNSGSSKTRQKTLTRSEYRGTNASSLRLALSDSSSNTMTQYHATPGIVLNQFKAKNGIVLGQHQTLKDVEIEKTPTNSPVRIGQASTAKKARLLLSSKRQDLETPLRGRILAAGSSEEEDTDSNTPLLNNVNRRLRYTQKSASEGSPIVVARSDDEESPPPNLSVHKSKGVLSTSKIDRISSWLNSLGSSNTSRLDPQVTESHSQQELSKGESSGTRLPSDNSVSVTRVSSPGHQDDNAAAADITEDITKDEAELVEKVNSNNSQDLIGIINNRVINNRVSSSSEMMCSERTSKARFSSSNGYSGGSERTSSKGLSSESNGFNSSDRTSKASDNRLSSASYGISSVDGRSSKAGLSRNSSDSYGIMSDDIGVTLGGSSDRTSKAGLSNRSSYNELNAGRWSNRVSSTEPNSASDNTESPVESYPSERTSKQGCEYSPTEQHQQKSESDSPYHTATSGSGTGSGKGSDRPEDQVAGRSSDLPSWRSNSNTSRKDNTSGGNTHSSHEIMKDSNEENAGYRGNTDEGAPKMIPLSDLCTSNATIESTFRGNFVYGNDSVDISVHTHQEPDKETTSENVKTTTKSGKNPRKPVKATPKTKASDKSGKKAGEISRKYNPSENQTIDNSVDAVRAWTSTIEREVRDDPSSISEESQGKEKFTEAQQILISSDEEDNFDTFLSTLKNKDKNTAAAKNTSDGNDDDFIVPDDQFDSSDYLSSPTMSLADKIKNKKSAAERKKSTRADHDNSDSDTNDKPSKKIRDKQISKDKVKSPVYKSNVILDSPDSSPNTVRPRRVINAKKNYVIRSDSDSRTSSPSSEKGSSSGSLDIQRKLADLSISKKSGKPKTQLIEKSPKPPTIKKPSSSGSLDIQKKLADLSISKKSGKPKTPLTEKSPKPPTIKKPSITQVTKTSKTLTISKTVAPKDKEQTPKSKTTAKTSQVKEFLTPKSNVKLKGSDTCATPKTLTFLSSLTLDTPKYRCHPEALQYTTNFKKKKEELSSRLYHLYNKEVFEGCLPGDMEIKWNVRLTKTAGLCYSKRYKNKYGVETRSSRIELSAKVIDSADRLRDTLVHEMCHAASWIISGYRDGHGPQWKVWANKSMVRFPELPVIDRCHAYQIKTKYTYVCVQCSYSIGRHSKSLDTEKKVCGHCYGRFELVVNTKTSSNKENRGESSSNSAPRTPNAFALFTKENYQKFRKPGTEHKEVMAILSQEFHKAKEEAKKQNK